ncbi:MAG: AAA family ATPase [Cellulomonadaceae bacterium]
MIRTIAVGGYRTLRDVVLELGRLTLVTGANGSGKSNLYRALRLLAECGDGRVITALAREGGLPSALWAGPEQGTRGRRPAQGTVRTGPVALRLGYRADDLSYAIELGLPQDGGSAFMLDPEIKVETVWAGDVPRPATILAQRHGGRTEIRDTEDQLARGPRLATHESMIGEFADVGAAPELAEVRRTLRSWRFYDQFRTDPLAPARSVQIGTRTPVLAADGTDLAAAIETVREAGYGPDLDAAVAEAFPGASVRVTSESGRFALMLDQDGLLRGLTAAELSDGTLRYLLLVAALLSPDPPRLLVLNEPETSLHPDLLPALGRLIARAAARVQTIVVTHSATLVRVIEEATGQDASADGAWAVDAGASDGPGLDPDDVVHVHLRRRGGESTIDGREGLLDVPRWVWPKR